jgi:uncharacterized protein YutE (UPF0331/DUF86 family)
MIDSIQKHIETLIVEGRRLLNSLGSELWVPDEKEADSQRWFTSGVNVVFVVAPPESIHRTQMAALVVHPDLKTRIRVSLARRALGILEALAVDLKAGLLNKFEYIILGISFDNFLDHAADFHRADKKQEAAVLVGVVLEDTIRKIAEKHGLRAKGPSLELLIDELVKLNVLTPVKAKRVKAYAGTRNRALHADWEAFDIRDVGEMIMGIRELIENVL